ncbi:TOM (translocase of outer membrane) complex component [Emydomyces testavorans]|uniref:TOM (Translocase of outer membrane) complex component n=1 Tax=Emydomyces testavorans TaxID=2070801 RepID=A0AAF0DKR0_9EURO|nr:TOM (translocase of outer membrane) complex component [Emydomyces testavorans]
MSAGKASQPTIVSVPAAETTIVSTPVPSSSTASLWDRVSKWASEHKALVYTIAGVAVVVTSAGVVYYLSDSGRIQTAAQPGEKRKSKKERRREKKKAEEEKKAEAAKASESRIAEANEAEEPEELPEVDETIVQALDAETRALYAGKLKAAGNKAFGSKDYNRAIELYGKAILCKPDPVYYSNRAACYNALSEWDKVVEDTTAAIAMDDEYVKALNRRANAYEKLEKYRDALLDYTASCMIDEKEPSRQAVERLLKKFAEQKAHSVMEGKAKKLPSATFVSNYLQSFRPKPIPEGLDENAELEEESGKGQLRKGFQAIAKHTSDGYEEAARAFEKALELGGLEGFEALALNMRATFIYLTGDAEAALKDLNRSIELDSSLVQSYIKRASLYLEMSNREAAAEDFELALAQNKDDPDIYYHRAQLHLILGEIPDAAKDYQKSIDLDRDFIYSHIQLGVAQYKMGSVASAMATFRRTLKNFDNVADVYNYYGELLLDQQKYSEAIEKFDRAVELEKSRKPWGINVLPLINKAITLFQWKHDFQEAENLCQKALIIDPECDIAVSTLSQLLLQQGKVSQALKHFERAAELARTEPEVVHAISFAEAIRAQLDVQEKYPKLAARVARMGGAPGFGSVF